MMYDVLSNAAHFLNLGFNKSPWAFRTVYAKPILQVRDWIKYCGSQVPTRFEGAVKQLDVVKSFFGGIAIVKDVFSWAISPSKDKMNPLEKGKHIVMFKKSIDGKPEPEVKVLDYSLQQVRQASSFAQWGFKCYESLTWVHNDVQMFKFSDKTVTQINWLGTATGLVSSLASSIADCNFYLKATQDKIELHPYEKMVLVARNTMNLAAFAFSVMTAPAWGKERSFKFEKLVAGTLITIAGIFNLYYQSQVDSMREKLERKEKTA